MTYAMGAWPKVKRGRGLEGLERKGIRRFREEGRKERAWGGARCCSKGEDNRAKIIVG